MARFLMAVISGLVIIGCQAADENGAQAAAAASKPLEDNQKLYYFLGTRLARNLAPLELDRAQLDLVIRGVTDQLAGTAEQLDDAVYMPMVQELAAARMRDRTSGEREKAAAYVKQMAAEEGAVTTESGLVYRELVAGTGKTPTSTSVIKAHYTGTLRDGSVFDSSIARGQPLEIALNGVIPCWTEGIALMKEGGKAKLTCPPDMAYGDRGSGAIPGGAALTFEVELLEVVN